MLRLNIKHTVETTASPSTIWKIWEDVRNWNSWDAELEFSTMNGPFVDGTTGTMKLKGAPLIQTTLMNVVPLKSFDYVCKLPLSRIVTSHSITEVQGKTYVSVHIKFRGLLAPFFAFHIGREKKIKGLQAEMIAMVRKAEGALSG